MPPAGPEVLRPVRVHPHTMTWLNSGLSSLSSSPDSLPSSPSSLLFHTVFRSRSTRFIRSDTRHFIVDTEARVDKLESEMLELQRHWHVAELSAEMLRVFTTTDPDSPTTCEHAASCFEVVQPKGTLPNIVHDSDIPPLEISSPRRISVEYQSMCRRGTGDSTTNPMR